jgi:hypothetical protein
MSTGDLNLYIRGKQEVRRKTADARFTKDGFDEWAESTRPAREGQLEKEPAEEQMESYGGALTLPKAKRMLRRVGRVGGDIKTDILKLVPEELKKSILTAVARAKQVVDVYRNISARIDDGIEEIQAEVVENPSMGEKVRGVAEKLVAKFKEIKQYKDELDRIATMLEKVGMGGAMHGGDLASTAKAVVDKVKEYGSKLLDIVKFFYSNAPGIKYILKLKALNPPEFKLGEEILKYTEPLFTLAGAGAGRVGGGRHCGCSDDESEEHCPEPSMQPMVVVRKVGGRKVGGAKAKPSSAAVDEMEAKLRAALNDSKVGGRRKVSVAPSDEHDAMLVPMGGRKVGGRRPRDESEVMAQIGGRKVGGKVGGKKPSARGAIVKKVMKEKGLSLPQASKYVKDHGLYKA